MAEPMSDERLEQLAGLAELPCTCGLADCENWMSALTREQAQELLAEVKRARAELEQLRAEVRPEWRIEFDVWHGTDGPTFSREPSARNWLHSYRDNNPGKNDARLQQRYRSDWADVEQQPENSKTTCAFPDCGHPDHQREQQPERGSDAGGAQ